MDDKSKKVVFNNKTLEKIVKESIGIKRGDVTIGDILKLTDLHIEDTGVTDLVGLECAENLRFLTIAGSQIPDLTPISSLVNITRLYLYHGVTKDISPLANLVNLKELKFYHAGVIDFSCLGRLPKLKNLAITENCLFYLFTPSDQNARILLNGLIDQFKYSIGLHPIYADHIRLYLYNPSEATALAALCITPKAYPFVRAEFTGESTESLFARVFAATKAKKNYIKELLELRLLDGNWADIIDATGNAKAKRILFDLELTAK